MKQQNINAVKCFRIFSEIFVWQGSSINARALKWPSGNIEPFTCCSVDEGNRFYFSSLGISRQKLDYRSLNIDTFNAISVLMDYALPEEARVPPVQ